MSSMAKLRNVRHERFAQDIAAGKSAAQAYLAAGLRADRRSAWRVRHRSDVVRRVDELIQTERKLERQAMAKAAQRYEVTAERVIGELARIGFANIHDLIEIGDDGEPRVSLAAISRDEAAALQEVTVEHRQVGRDGKPQQGRRIKVKLGDKISALVALGKHLGLFVEPARTDVNVLNVFSERPPTLQEWKREIESQASGLTIPE
jgi:phage terminase small subunit